MSNNHSNKINDLPRVSIAEDRLDFKPYVEVLSDIIQSSITATPLTIGVFGSWGSGKTSLMKMISNELNNQNMIIWFNAWKYEKAEAIWRALLMHVLTAIQEQSKKVDKELEELKVSLYRTIEKEKSGQIQIDWGDIAKQGIKGSIKIALSAIPGGSFISSLKDFLSSDATYVTDSTEKVLGALKREKVKYYIEQVQFLEQFHERFQTLVKKSTENSRRVVLFIDDLDRCVPEKAIEVFEAIKLFMDVPDCVFVLGVDPSIISTGIHQKYQIQKNNNDEKLSTNKDEISIGKRYLDKIIQLPFHLPKISKNALSHFIYDLVEIENWPHQKCLEVFANSLEYNPRQIKRAINVFFLLWKLAKIREFTTKGIHPIRLAKVIVIQHSFPHLYSYVREQTSLIRDLEKYFISKHKNENHITDNLNLESSELLINEPPKHLMPFIYNSGVERLLMLFFEEELFDSEVSFSNLDFEQLEAYFTLAKSTEVENPDFVDSIIFIEPEILIIPKGDFLMGEEESDIEANDIEKPQIIVRMSEFGISKYPITNREYQVFILKTNQEPPPHWQDKSYPKGKGDSPVDHVSWDHAKSYCDWLSEVTGNKYTLPTEAQWEKAARGQDGRKFPWGNEWRNGIINSLETKIGSTSSVGKFSPDSDSPYGLSDVSGNVWEWCLDWITEEERIKMKSNKDLIDPVGQVEKVKRALRGGAFRNPKHNARCVFRLKSSKFSLAEGFGFRIVRIID